MYIESGLRRDARGVHRLDPDNILDLLCDFIRLGARQIDLVDDRLDLEIVVKGEINISEGLRLNTLGRIDNEHSPVAGCERARHFIIKVDMARRVDQVEDIFLPVVRPVDRPDRLGLDRDPALPLEIHVVEDLLLHLTLGQESCHLDNAVREGGLAVVYMGYYTKVPDIALIHSLSSVIIHYICSIIRKSHFIRGPLQMQSVPKRTCEHLRCVLS